MSDSDDATLADSSAPTRDSARYNDLGPRYELREVIGRGGMGEIRVARDTKIEREVAIKLMRAASTNEVGVRRFLREARVQGVLDHPAVVPVHDLDHDRDGNPYFVMKRLAGTTLADVLASEDAASRARWPRRQLLARLVDICLAVEFAHTRGVIHRDLKPANIMIGDFGEAYVLDWGLARLVTSRDSQPRLPSSEDLGATSGEPYEETRAGDLLGTPGYMSPEQARGEPARGPADIYALGCILFEILVGEPALPRGLAGLAESLSTPCHRPAQHASDVAPELDELCARATALDAAHRPSARQLADGIQAYLDGDHDLARRHELADAHARAARDAMRAPGDDARATAVREAGRALALDPENATAQQVLGKLLITAPEEMPEAALEDAKREREESRRAAFGLISHAFLAISAIALTTMFLPLRHTWAVGLTAACALGAWGVTRRLHASTVPGRSPWYMALLLMCSGMLILCGVMLGPLLIMPMFVIGSISGFMSQPSEYRAMTIIGASALPFVLVMTLELAGVLPQSIQFHDGGLLLRAWVIDHGPVATTLVVGGTFVVQMISTSLVGISTMRVQREAQNRMHAQTWHLKQLLPHAVERTTPTPKVAPPRA